MIEIWGLASPNVHKVILALEELALPYGYYHVDCPNIGPIPAIWNISHCSVT